MLKIEKLENEIPVYDINVENNHNFFANDILVHNCVESYSNFKPSKVLTNTIKKEDGKNIIVRETLAGEIHTCNLNSINLANIDTDADLHEVCITAVRLLDNAIDFTDVPIKEGEIHNNIYRTIGVGCVARESYVDVVKKIHINGVEYDINDSILKDGELIPVKNLIND